MSSLHALDPERGLASWRLIETPHDERVLHVHLETHIDPQRSLVKALLAMSPNHYSILRWSPYDFHLSQFARRQETFLRMCKADKPTLVFMQLQMPGVISPETLQEARRIVPEATFVCWCGDIGRVNGPHVTEESAWGFETAKEVDLMLYTSLAQVKSHRMQGMQNAAYLQIGYEEELFSSRHSDDTDYAYDCVFFGQNYQEKAWASVPEQEIQLRRDAIQVARDVFGDRFGLFGQNWPDASMHMMRPEDTALAYRRSKTALSMSLVSTYGRYTSDRLFRAMACGTPTFVKKFDDMESLGLKHGVNCIVWDTIEDLRRGMMDVKIPPAPNMLRGIGEAGAALMKHHTWKIRMKELMPLVYAVRGTKKHSTWRPTW